MKSPNSQILIIALTASAMQGTREKRVESGMDIFFTNSAAQENVGTVVRKRWIRSFIFLKKILTKFETKLTITFCKKKKIV